MHRRTLSVLWTLILTVALAPACRPLLSGAERQPAPANARSAHPADLLDAAHHLPRTAPLLLVVDELESALQGLGRDELISRFREPYERTVFEIVRGSGHDFIGPEGLRQLGVDVEARAVAAAIDARFRTWVVAIRLTDPLRFKTELYRSAKRLRFRSKPQVLADSLLLGGAHLAVVLRDDTAMIVRSDGDALTEAERLAKMPLADSLQRHQPFRAALRGIDSRFDDLLLYADPRAIFFANRGMDPRWKGRSHSEALATIELAHRDALARAVERAASVSEIVAIDRDFRSARHGLRDDPEAEKLREAFGGVQTVGIGATVSHDKIELHANLGLEKGTLLRRLLVNQRDAPRLVRAIQGAPVALLQGTCEPKVALSYARAVLGVELKGLAGVDFDKEVVAFLTGEVGLALMLDPKEAAVAAGREGPQGGWPHELHIAGFLGVSEAPAVRRIVQRAVAHEELASLVERQKDGWLLKAPGFRPIHLRLGQGYLTFATDESFSKRVLAEPSTAKPSTAKPSTAKPSTAKPSTARPNANRALAMLSKGGSLWQEDSALDLAFDLSLPTLWYAGTWLGHQPDKWQPPPVADPAYQTKLRELAQLDEQLAVASGRLAREELEHFLSLSREVGSLALSAREHDWGLSARLSWASAGAHPVVAAADLVIDVLGIGEVETTKTQRLLRQLRSKRGPLLDELDDIRERVEFPKDAGGSDEPASKTE